MTTQEYLVILPHNRQSVRIYYTALTVFDTITRLVGALALIACVPFLF